MATAGNKNDPAAAKKLFENLQNDLRSLSSEAKKKFQNVKEVRLTYDQSFSDLRSA